MLEGFNLHAPGLEMISLRLNEPRDTLGTKKEKRKKRLLNERRMDMCLLILTYMIIERHSMINKLIKFKMNEIQVPIKLDWVDLTQ